MYKEEDFIRVSGPRSAMKNAQHIFDKCIYKRLHILGVVIYFEYNNSESANIMETLFNQISTVIGNVICSYLDHAWSSHWNQTILLKTMSILLSVMSKNCWLSGKLLALVRHCRICYVYSGLPVWILQINMVVLWLVMWFECIIVKHVWC